MQLIADRFVVDDRGRAIDLASGEVVQLVWSAARAPHEHARWLERCEWFASLRHPLLARLIDYGAFGPARRFEAWCLRRRTAAHVVAGVVLDRANGFLAAEGRTPIGRREVAVGLDCGRLVGLPDAEAGFPEQSCAGHRALPARLDVLGVVRRVDRRVAALVDLFETPPDVPVAIGVWEACDGAAWHVQAVLARAARISGIVPVCAPLLDGLRVDLVAGRTLLVICTAEATAGWSAVVRATLQVPRPHLVVFAGKQQVHGVDTILVERQTAEALVASVRPAGLPPAVRQRVQGIARRSGGVAARFEQLLWGCHVDGRATMRQARSRAAERSVRYVVADHALPRLRRDLAAAQDQLDRGSHAAGARAAREAMAALARRGDWAHAACGALALARTLRRRGEVDAAERLLRSAADWARQSGDARALNGVALTTGKLLTDAGHLDEAQRTLAVALAAGRSGGHPEWREAARALARCQFWRGQFDEAWDTVAERGGEGGGGEGVSWSALRARIAIGRARIGEAIAEAAAARDAARAVATADAAAVAGYASAQAQLAAGDLARADDEACEALEAARHARRQSLAVCLRLVRAEIARRQGAAGPASLLLARLSRAPSTRLPAILSARLGLLRDLLAGVPPPEAAARRGAATGFRALVLLVPRQVDVAGSGAVEAIEELLQCCQDAGDDRAVLAGLCARLRVRLRAAAVAFFLLDRDQFVPASSDGGRPDAAMAVRVHAARQLVLPHRGGERIEAGVPVRYAGRVVGVLTARWAPASRWRDDQVALLLSTAAVAAGPALSAVADRRRAAAVAATSDLIGVSAAMVEVRGAIDRMAAAPFPVLIEGESGSGKELVARSLHRQGPRRDKPFCALNCAALPDDLVESELFGHARGAFTGAMAERRGVFEEAHGGTLFLDEIGELSLRAQAKLLRVVQEGEVRRLGENLNRRVDVRIVSATNRNLRVEADAGRFRMDLLFRLDVIRIALPPLRQRVEDIELLAEHFWRACCARLGSRATLAGATIAALARYAWPGNVRELENVLASLAVRAPRRGLVPPTALPPHVCGASQPSVRLDDARQAFECGFVRAALARAGGSRTRAAEELGMSRQGLAKLMDRLRIDDREIAPQGQGPPAAPLAAPPE